MRIGRWWGPAVILALGAVATSSVSRQKTMPLVRPLKETVFSEFLGYEGRDLPISDTEAAVVGFTDYLYRMFEPPLETGESGRGEGSPGGSVGDQIPWFSVYVGYYESQAQGNTIHSPKNCLPGAGWEALSSEDRTLHRKDGAPVVNRYLLQNENDRALVLYWYQGRGRIANDEYRVKLDLLRDAALKRRSDEALVRVVVPVVGEEGAAEELALRVARELAFHLERALPAG